MKFTKTNFVEAIPVPHFQFLFNQYNFDFCYTHECCQTPKPPQNDEPTVSAIYNMQNVPTTKSGTCRCTPCRHLGCQKNDLDGPLQNEELATNLAQNQSAQHSLLLVHFDDFQKNWPLQSGEPGRRKHLSIFKQNGYLKPSKPSKIQRSIL
jgi:hypothetical protein